MSLDSDALESNNSGYSRHKDPPVSLVAPESIRKLLLESRSWNDNLASLAIGCVKAQLELAAHETVTRCGAHVTTNNDVPSLFDTSALRLVQSIGDDTEEMLNALDALPPDVRGRVLWKINGIVPYVIFCQLAREDGAEGDLDEWVLRNETWLRNTGSGTPHYASEDATSLGEPASKVWSYGLVQLSAHASSVFPGSKLTDTCRIVTRSTSLSGFKVLDGRHSPAIRIQPSIEMYSKTFEKMTQNLMRGLNWDNVFVAGGIALGTLLCTNDEQATNKPEEWESSDVDLYIYGLGPIEANEKIEHIFNVFKSNLPEDVPILVVRNSKTITFFSKYPLRRIQVVLKLVATPKDVLLNFDLDICAVGWDGTEVWMLPRAARSLETGYTVFTMDLINGHYLGERRATQEQRVFKYADKGYGIRILPSCLAEIQRIRKDKEKQSSTGTRSGTDDEIDVLDIEKIAQDSRTWTLRAIKELAKVPYPLSERRQPLPQMSHSWLQDKYQNTEDPAGKSCLSGLALFMRHVALWEHEVAGDIIISNDVWAAPMYDNVYYNQNGVSYNDSPDYLWDEGFETKHFIPQIDLFNKAEIDQMEHNIKQGRDNWSDESWGYPDKEGEFSDQDAEKKFSTRVPGLSVQRITHAVSAYEVLQNKCDIYLPVWLPAKFVDFVEDSIATAVRESGVKGYTTPVFIDVFKKYVGEFRPDPELHLVIWHVTNITMWQQLHRAIDEVHEVIWSFHRANSDLDGESYDRQTVLWKQLGRRAIRRTTQEECAAFVRWVAKSPVPVSWWGSELYSVDNPEDSSGSDSEDYEDE